MRMGWLRHLMLAAALVPGAAMAAAPPGPQDYLKVLAEAPWPLEILAFCYSTVDRDPAFQDIGGRWRLRNDGLLATVEEKADGAVAPALRHAADTASLAAIRRLVARQSDKAAWCRMIAQVIDRGAYDIDRRSDLRDALKRIFGRE